MDMNLPAGRTGEQRSHAVFGSTSIEDRLYRYDASRLTYISYSDLDPDEFGKLKNGDGYWLFLDQATTISYQGYVLSGYQPVDLSLAGWHMIGVPHNHNTLLGNCKVAGREGLTVYLATTTQGWLQELMYGYYPAQSRYWEVGLEGSPIMTTTPLRMWQGYWCNTFVPGLTLNRAVNGSGE